MASNELTMAVETLDENEKKNMDDEFKRVLEKNKGLKRELAQLKKGDASKIDFLYKKNFELKAHSIMLRNFIWLSFIAFIVILIFICSFQGFFDSM